MRLFILSFVLLHFHSANSLQFFWNGSAWKGENVTEIVLSALNQGYRHLDNAAFYANQESVADSIRASAIPRDELYLTSKYDRLNEAKDRNRNH